MELKTKHHTTISRKEKVNDVVNYGRSPHSGGNSKRINQKQQLTQGGTYGLDYRWITRRRHRNNFVQERKINYAYLGYLGLDCR